MVGDDRLADDFRIPGQAGAVLVSQFPTTGQIPHTPTVATELLPSPGYCGPGSGDGGNRGEYATMELLQWALKENQ